MMKHLSMTSMTWRTLDEWRFAILAALVLCVGLAVPGRGGVGGGNGETVGTLPDTGGHGAGIDISRTCHDASPSLYLEGTLDQIYETVLGWTGRGVITEEVLNAPAHVVRLTFHGDLRVELDRHIFEQGFVRIGWTVPQAFGPARATMFLGNRTIASGLVSARSLSLPILELEANGGLDVTPLSVITTGRQGHPTSLEVYAQGDELILRQTR